MTRAKERSAEDSGAATDHYEWKADINAFRVVAGSVLSKTNCPVEHVYGVRAASQAIDDTLVRQLAREIAT